MHPLAAAAAATADGMLPESAQVRAELQKILSSEEFDVSDRSKKLLEYVVHETLAGRGDRIKAYSIATEVFGRPPSFDAQNDPIVRIEAAKLRKAMEHYYLTGGKDDTVRIEIAKGGYVPAFSLQSPAGHDEPAAPPVPPRFPGWLRKASVLLIVAALAAGLVTSGWLTAGRNAGQDHSASADIPAVIVRPLTDLTRSDESKVFAQGLSESIIEKTSRFKELMVVPGTDKSAQPLAGLRAPRYEFGGTLRMTDGDVLVQTRLVDRRDGNLLWAESFDASRRAKQLFNVEVEIANQIATELAEPHGVVFQAERKLMLESPPENWTAYACTLRAYAYRTTFAAEQFQPVRECLEKATRQEPDYATAWALLSLSYLDEFRFLFPPPPGAAEPALERALKAARRAVELDPAHTRGQQALMTAHFFANDTEAALEIGRAAMALNPNDLELKGEYGRGKALAGNWTEGCALLQDALDSSARKTGYYKSLLALCSYFTGDTARAVRLIRDADAQENPAYHIIAAALLAEAGEMEEAAVHRAWLESHVPQQLPALLAGVPSRIGLPQERARFLGSLRKAGLPAP